MIELNEVYKNQCNRKQKQLLILFGKQKLIFNSVTKYTKKYLKNKIIS